MNIISAFTQIVNKKANKILGINDKFLLGCQAVAGISVTELAETSNLSRTTVYHAKDKVLQIGMSLEEEHSNYTTVTITPNLLERMVLSLSLDCHASLEGIQRFFESVLDQEAIKQYDVFFILFGWLRELLGFAGYGREDTEALVTFVLDEMNLVAGENKQLLVAIAKFRKALPEILPFHSRLQKKFEITAKEKGILPDAFALLYQLRTLDSFSTEYNQLLYQLTLLLMNDSVIGPSF